MAEETTYRKLQKKAFAICGNAGLSKMDRLDVAREIFKRPIESFNDLHQNEMEDLCFALEGWSIIQGAREANGAILNEARVIVGNDELYTQALTERRARIERRDQEMLEAAEDEASQDRPETGDRDQDASPAGNDTKVPHETHGNEPVTSSQFTPPVEDDELIGEFVSKRVSRRTRDRDDD